MPWSEPRLAAASGLVVFALVLVATGHALRFARTRSMLDQPGERRSHAVATPRGGGLAIAAVLVAAWCALAARFASPFWWAAALAVAAVALVGWLDDRRPRSIALRLGVHVAAGAGLAAGVLVEGGDPMRAALAFLLVPCLVNAWNFIDGIDGLATSQAALAAGGIAVASGGATEWGATLLMAGCVGFLPWNLPRARIFLGDVGSGTLGCALAVLVVAGMEGEPLSHAALLALPLLPMCLDSGLTLAWRRASGQRWWEPHVQHLYQRLARRHGHARVTGLFGLWTTAAVVGMLALQHAAPATGWALASGMAVLGALVWRRWHGTGAQ